MDYCRKNYKIVLEGVFYCLGSLQRSHNYKTVLSDFSILILYLDGHKFSSVIVVKENHFLRAWFREISFPIGSYMFTIAV